MVIFETDPENMYVRKPRRNAKNADTEEKKLPDNYIEYYINIGQYTYYKRIYNID